MKNQWPRCAIVTTGSITMKMPHWIADMILPLQHVVVPWPPANDQ